MIVRQIRKIVVSLAGLSIVAVTVRYAAGDDAPASDHREQVARAIERGLAVVQKGARNYPSHRKCFACHHQTMPLLGVTAARAAGQSVEAEVADDILKFTETAFRGKLDELKAGEGIGGKGLTVGYGLWTFKLGGTHPDEVTEAMVGYLLKLQQPDGHWELHSIRPPAEESLVMCAVIAASGIKSYAVESQREAATVALNKARAWLATAKIETHEDRVARLWGLSLLGGDTDEQLAAARKSLLEAQRPDGGWAQLSDMESDAYATGSALYVLLDTQLPQYLKGNGAARTPSGSTSDEKVRSGECGADNDGLPAATDVDAALARAADWLLKAQLDDGSWHVKTRAKPVQVYFDNGDPHGKDQFLSMAATGWSTAALARTLSTLEHDVGESESRSRR